MKYTLLLIFTLLGILVQAQTYDTPIVTTHERVRTPDPYVLNSRDLISTYQAVHDRKVGASAELLTLLKSLHSDPDYSGNKLDDVGKYEVYIFRSGEGAQSGHIWVTTTPHNQKTWDVYELVIGDKKYDCKPNKSVRRNSSYFKMIMEDDRNEIYVIEIFLK